MAKPTPVVFRSKRPRSMAGVYLEDAYEALQSAGDPAALYGNVQEGFTTSDTGRRFALIVAHKVHHNECRKSILFSALAAEAYVNEALKAKLTNKDFDAIDKLTTVNKYVVGTRLALGKPLFKRGTAPIPTIEELFKLRHKLVHPKPGFAPSHLTEPAGEFEQQFTAGRAAEFVVMVAAAAHILVSRAFDEDFDFPASIIWHGRQPLFRFADEIAARLPLPEAPRPKLFAQMTEAVTAGVDAG